MPQTDDEIFEVLTAAVFQARFEPEIVRHRWPALRRAFAEFSLRKVAAWPETEVERLLGNMAIIRNRKKILATIRNARDLLERAERHGSARAYLDSFRPDRQALLEDIDKWAHYIGAPSIEWFLRCVGIGEEWGEKGTVTSS
jgi:DNA-3-methyladenine glycosylase I